MVTWACARRFFYVFLGVCYICNPKAGCSPCEDPFLLGHDRAGMTLAEQTQCPTG